MIKFVQINAYRGMYKDNLIAYINKIEPDFIAMQEVSSGAVNLAESKEDLFVLYKDNTGMEGVREIDFTTKPVEGSFGNAVFSRHKISSVLVTRFSGQIIKDVTALNDPKTFPATPRHLLEVHVDYKGRNLAIMSWHGVWQAPPVDNVATGAQADQVCARLDYLNSVGIPFILGGDLNAVPESYTVSEVEKRCVNLMKRLDVNMTTHPKVHKIAPRGFVVDYIFTSKHFKVIEVEVPTVTISDHLPVYAQLEI